jgi:uncharacterized glyoxalase superfamily protein PhnB
LFAQEEQIPRRWEKHYHYGLLFPARAFGKGCVMAGTLKNDGAPPTAPGQGSSYIVADSAATVDALHTRALAAGARIVVSLRDTDYGSHDFGCLDPEGNGWGFGTYAPA